MKSRIIEHFPEWVKLPSQMQYQFFELAEKQAKQIKEKLLKDKEKLDNLGKLLSFKRIPKNDEWKNWRIGVVDGSDSPVMSERVGGRFGTYGATYHIFQGLDLVEDKYFSGNFSDFQVGDPEVSKKLLSLLTTKFERETALSCLEKDVDLLLIDGSFFGFRPRCRIVHNQEVPNEAFRKGAELVKHIRDLSIKLLETRKVVGIIKRVQTSAIDGWMIHRNGNDKLRLNRNDKEILSSLIREGEWFSYEATFQDPVLFNYYTRLALAYHRYAADPSRSMESIFDVCKGDVDRNVRRDLLCEPEDILRTARHYVRCSYPTPPFCFETPLNLNLDPLLAFFKASCNKATGLPMPLDLTDQDITIPAGFTQEFVEEIEAHLVKDPDLNKYELENHFASLNPQKQE
jgi:hypothetical protein